MARTPDDLPGLPADALVRLVDELADDVSRILESHCLREEEAETLVYETMVAVGHRWDRISDPKRYFLDALERACARSAEVDPETPS